MIKYLIEIQRLTYSFSRLDVLQVSHEENVQTNIFARLVSTQAPKEG